MRPPPPRATRQLDQGVALVIVLAFVLLLTGLVLAFFSRALSERQISNSSAGQVKIDLFIQGAIATIVGDLKQEIAAGSNATYYVDSTANGLASVYLPFNPVTVAPALALKGMQGTVTLFPTNLLKRSAYTQNFFPGSGDPGAANYNSGNTVTTVVEPVLASVPTPTPSPAPTPLPSNRAANLSTTIASTNGRAISPVRWNKSLLLPKANPTSSTDNTPYFEDPGNPNPTSTPARSQSKMEFVPPDWVLVARDGSNPGSMGTAATFASSGTSVNNAAPSNQGFVTGRFAYTIYDEGGLLDANVAGYPTAAGKYPSENPSPVAPGLTIPQAKPLLSYADLTIPIPSDATNPASNPQLNMLTDAQVNGLVGWRNYASSKPTGGAFPNYTPGPTVFPTGSPAFSNFDLSVLTSANGLTAVSNASLYNNQSDRMLGSRQELINLFTQGLPNKTDTVALANLQNSLQYFGTFSRGLNQPSYVPVSRVKSATNLNPRPLIQPSAPLGTQPGGGNNVGDFYTNEAKQEIFGPSLLNVRVEANVPADPTKNLGRSNGTDLVLGEPLVKNRFALQRLAWVTYTGPSALNMSDAVVMKTIQALGGDPLNPTDRIYLFVAQGTVQNIKNYFGLTWDSRQRAWSYNVHNGGTATSAAAVPAMGSIMKLPDIADQKMREPDFFELLKASVDPGALGKAATNGPLAEPGDTGTPPNNTHFQPLNYQFYNDVSIDAAIVQLGANIIDQFDIDGFPTRIVFDDGTGGVGAGTGSGAREFRGVENLPYIYRIRTGEIKARDSIPPSQSVPNGSGAYNDPYQHSGPSQNDPSTNKPYVANPLKDTGAGIVIAVPDIWNPHDQNSSLGTPRPGTAAGSIRLVANSATPDRIFYNTVNNIPINTPADGYSTYTCGTFVGTDTPHGSFRGTSYSTTSGATAPNPGAMPPIPYFTRGANPNGTLAAPTQIMGNPASGTNGGFNYPHKINIVNSTWLTFKVPDNSYFREPTMLAQADTTSTGSGLAMMADASALDFINLQNSSGTRVMNLATPTYGFKSLNGNPLQAPGGVAQGFIGIALGTYPLRWVGHNWNGADSSTLWNYPAESLASGGNPVYAITYSLQYQDPINSAWVTYDEKYVDSDLVFVDPYRGELNQPKGGAYSFADPRTSRFGSATENNISNGNSNSHFRAPLAGSPPNNWSTTWVDAIVPSKPPTVMSERPDISSGFGSNFRGFQGGNRDWGVYAAPGLHTQNIVTGTSVDAIFFQTGLFAQNDPNYSYNGASGGPGSDGFRFVGDVGVGPRDGTFWSDPDGVVRRASGAYVTSTGPTAQPLATATKFNGGIGSPLGTQNQSRPAILNRPFRTVGELGYVFTGNPWKNVDFSTPESAYSELLDVFCVNDGASTDGIVAGKVNLNTHQQVVLKSILTGAYTDEDGSMTNPIVANALKPLAAADADAIATLLVNRTKTASPTNTFVTGPQPLQNLGDMVGRWNSKQTIPGNFTPPLGSVHNVDGSKSYDGFSADLTSLSSNLVNLSKETIKIPRMRESAMRSLSNVGNTRVWNLMIDVIAQSGRYPPAASALNNFVVEGEERCWLHVAIDRYTGAVLDTKLEVVKE